MFQDLYGLVRYADSNYSGTARSTSLCHAASTSGGDLGAVGLNPAGAAAAAYSQFTLTPGLSISSCTSAYAPIAEENVTGRERVSRSRFILPNLGFVLNRSTGRKSGIVNYSFGLILNMPQVYNECVSAGGINNNTSMMGETAFFCSSHPGVSGIPRADLEYGDGYDPYRDSNHLFSDILAFQSGMISSYGCSDEYIGSNEVGFDDGSILLGGPIHQRYSRLRSGSRSDAVINLAFNLDNTFCFGGNLAVVRLVYGEELNRWEHAGDPDDFSLVKEGEGGKQFLFWNDGQDVFTLRTGGMGLYLMLGCIWMPVNGLRLGASVKTPTWFRISERRQWKSICNYVGTSSRMSETPEYWIDYRLVSPFNLTFGMACSLPDRSVLSFDWERRDFRSMRLFDANDNLDEDSLCASNEYLRQNAGITHVARAGWEYQLAAAFSLRAGYSLMHYMTKESGTRNQTHSAAVGFGYSSPGSFFVDAAVRYTKCPDNWFYPYDDYLDVRSPEVCISNNLMDVILTLGWRF